MPNHPDSISGIAKDLFWAAVYGGVAALLPAPSQSAFDPTLRHGLITDDEQWTVEYIRNDVLPGQQPPREPAGYGNYQDAPWVTCKSCGESYRTTRWLIVLVTYSEEPHYTHARYTCPSDKCRLKRLTSFRGEQKLRFYSEAGYPVIVDGPTAPALVRKAFRNKNGSDRTPRQISGTQLDIYARALSSTIDEDYPQLLRNQPPKEQSA